MNAYIESENLRFLHNAWLQNYLKNGIGAFKSLDLTSKTDVTSAYVTSGSELTRKEHNVHAHQTKNKANANEEL